MTRRGVDPAPRQPSLEEADIAALARFGFFSIAANAKTVIVIDDFEVGEAPLVRLPLKPGVHKIKARSNNQVKRFDITIFRGKDTVAGTITW